MKCIYCTTELVADPERSHWLHCPLCNPAWAAHANRLAHLYSFDRYARAAAADLRGAPSIPGQPHAT